MKEIYLLGFVNLAASDLVTQGTRSMDLEQNLDRVGMEEAAKVPEDLGRRSLPSISFTSKNPIVL